ncbi:MAG: OB-fold nucleic acid binding domain-containing protein [Nanoarchaeota archaeon]
MISMPFPEIVAKIKAEAGLSEDEINKKVKQKLDSLSGLISKEGAAHIIANELGIKLVQEGPVLIKNLLSGMKNMEITGKVTRKYELREFSSGDRKGKVASLVLADESGFVRLVLWNDQADAFAKINEGDILQVQNGLVKENMGRKEIHMNTASKIVINPKGVAIEVKQDTVVRKKIADLVQGDDNVEIFGTIVQVFDIRFFETCPKCGKRLSRKEDEAVCEAHGTVIPDYGYVLNLFVDDGSGNTRVVLWRTQIQRLLKKTDEEIKEFQGKPADFEQVKSDLLGNFIKFVGRVNKNEGYDALEFVPRLVFPDPDPKDELDLAKKEKSKAVEPEKKAPEESELVDAVSADDFLDVKEEDFEE